MHVAVIAFMLTFNISCLPNKVTKILMKCTLGVSVETHTHTCDSSFPLYSLGLPIHPCAVYLTDCSDNLLLCNKLL